MEDCADGYALVATFQSSDRNFMHYRGFFDLHSRLLLELQFNVESLERELDRLDAWDSNSGEEKRQICLRSKAKDHTYSKLERMPDAFQGEFEKTRPEVFAELKQKLLEYGTYRRFEISERR